MHARPFSSILPLCWALAALALPLAAQARTGYGVSVGTAVPLDDSNALGGSIGVSAHAAGEEGVLSMLRARGELLGLFFEDGSLAVLPTLTGDIGWETGRLGLFASGGVQLFGVAYRQEFTAFSVLGIVGGVGLSVRLTPAFSLDCRGLVVYLPSETTAELDAAEGIDKPTFAYVTALVGLTYHPQDRPGPSPDDVVPDLGPEPPDGAPGLEPNPTVPKLDRAWIEQD